MQRAATFTLVLVLGSALATEVTPIQKVLTLMGEMKAKATTEKNDEEVRFSAFSQWCTNIKKSKTDEINAGNEKMEALAAAIEKAAVTIRKLTERILELEEDVNRWKKDKESATTVRDAERADFTATNTDYSESIDAVSGAIVVLKKQTPDKAQAALIQVRSLRLVPSASKDVLASFLQQDPELAYDAPEANAYENQSGGVIEMLEKLNDEFSSKQRELEKEELGAQQAYEQIMQQLRADELTAIDKAIEIIGSGAVAGSGDKHLPALLQIRNKAAALSQLRSNQASPAQLRVVSFLNEQARKSGSRLLSEIALSAQANPFGKVKKMIKDLIVKPACLGMGQPELFTTPVQSACLPA